MHSSKTIRCTAILLSLLCALPAVTSCGASDSKTPAATEKTPEHTAAVTEPEEVLTGRAAVRDNLPADIDKVKKNRIFCYLCAQIRKKWENAVHPAVREDILNRISYADRDGKKYFFLEAALLIENNYQEICSEIWYVYADEDLRRIRLRETRNYTDDKIAGIFKAQMKDVEYREYASFVIDTGINLENTRKQLENKLEEYETL